MEGVDLARFLAFVGVVIVDFGLAMGVGREGEGVLAWLYAGLHDWAVAAFLVVCGLTLGLADNVAVRALPVRVVLRRSGILLMLGLICAWFFPADLLHVYAWLYLLAYFCLVLTPSRLLGLLFGINLLYVILFLLLDYPRGWEPGLLRYQEIQSLWDPLRRLFFNGFYPLLPWLAFLAFGLLLSFYRLTDSRFQHRLILLGLGGFVFAKLLALGLGTLDPAGAATGLWSVESRPPMPLFVLAALGAASMLLGVCLRSSHWLAEKGILGWLLPAGRQTLTLYVLHILVGMGLLNLSGLLHGQNLHVVFPAALLFCWAAVIFAHWWNLWSQRGILESVVRGVD
ncbi:MAG: DUF418 domain-containing protein [Thiolinea sp.]